MSAGQIGFLTFIGWCIILRVAVAIHDRRPEPHTPRSQWEPRP